MKRGQLFFAFSFVFFIALILNVRSVAALSIGDLINSEWVNAALVFLLLFNFVITIFRDVFKRNYGAAVVISLVVAIAGSLSVVYYFGAFLSKIGLWLLIVFVVVIALLMMRFVKGKKGQIGFIVLGVASIAWLAWLHKILCPPLGTLPFNVCQILDVLTLIILAVVVVKVISLLLGIGKGKGGGGGGGGGRPDKPGKPDAGERNARFSGFIRDRNTHQGIVGAHVEFYANGQPHTGVQSTPGGHYFNDVPARGFPRGSGYTIIASAQGYHAQNRNVRIVFRQNKRVDFDLEPDQRGPGPGLHGPGENPRIRLFANGHERELEINAGESVNLQWASLHADRIQIIDTNGLNRTFQYSRNQRNLVIPHVNQEMMYEAIAHGANGTNAVRAIVHVRIRGGNGPNSPRPNQPGPNQPSHSQNQREPARFACSFGEGSEFNFGANENMKHFVIRNDGGGEIRWNSHAIPANILRLYPNQGILMRHERMDVAIQVNRQNIRAANGQIIHGAIGILARSRTLRASRGKISARVNIHV